MLLWYVKGLSYRGNRIEFKYRIIYKKTPSYGKQIENNMVTNSQKVGIGH